MQLLLLGHRGARASRDIPENTVESFELCMAHGCDGFECDVRRSADSCPVICHNPTREGLRIENTPSKHLSLCTLEVVLQKFSSRAFLDIELKVDGLEPLTLALLHKYPPQRNYVVSSFLPGVLAAIHTLDPTIALGFLCENAKQLRGWPETSAEWIIPHFSLANRPLIELIHAASKKVMVWTVNQPDHMREFAAWGVDAIISDETELLVRTLGRSC